MRTAEIERVDADYLVIGAGAMGMGFTDALIGHCDKRVVIVDRRHGVGGHWLEAYPFVRLHQASAFYGVPSTLLGGGRLQQRGPEKGLQERATQAEICSYYTHVLEDRFLASGRVEFFGSCEYVGDRTFTSRVSGRRYQVPESCRVVDGTLLEPDIPAETPPPFAVGDGARVLPVNELPRIEVSPPQFVITGSGKTATDAIIWLLDQGVDPDAICWVRPRDPWMVNRAKVQPDPAAFFGMAADMMEAAIAAETVEDLFLRLEDADVTMRIDRSVMPTMAKGPTLATWELELLRTVENVVRRGHVRRVERGALVFADGSVTVDADAVVVHCAASGLKYPAAIPVWTPGLISLQPLRAGFPCFGTAVIGYVEATRTGDVGPHGDAAKNRICLPSRFGDSMEQWAEMNYRGGLAARALNAEPDIKAWLDGIAINPARVPAGYPGSAELDDALARLQVATPHALEKFALLGGVTP